MISLPVLEILVTSTAFLILLIYHIHLIYQLRKAPMTTSIGLTNHLRLEWVQSVRRDNKDILAVQTMRNWVMASSFLASTAVLISLAISNAALRPDTSSGIPAALNLVGTTSQAFWQLKLMVLLLDFFFAFFNFALSIRYYNHASFLINTPAEHDQFLTSDYVTKVLNRGTTHYTLGMRAYYLAVPFVLWLFGPTWMLGGVILIVAILYKVDRII